MTNIIQQKDARILDIMQKEKLCVPHITKIAHRVHEPTSTVRDRILALQKSGVIKGYVPEIDPKKVGAEILVFVLSNLSDEALQNPDPVCEKIAKFDFVQGVYFLIGKNDILIKIRAKSIEDYRQKMMQIRKYIVGGGGIVVSKVFKDVNYVPIAIETGD
ncbi:Lrp/AsnC family transcriptional regulator [Candidatus Woesearchaeota archaeon]|nr:Lrp/AsnC family transcriptional regulator [Candidatus Woesearchaeota archaeon]